MPVLRNRHIVPLPKFPAILVRPSQVKSQDVEPPQALLAFCSWKQMPPPTPPALVSAEDHQVRSTPGAVAFRPRLPSR